MAKPAGQLSFWSRLDSNLLGFLGPVRERTESWGSFLDIEQSGEFPDPGSLGSITAGPRSEVEVTRTYGCCAIDPSARFDEEIVDVADELDVVDADMAMYGSASFDEGPAKLYSGPTSSGTTFVYGSTSRAHGAKSFRILCYGDSNTVGFRGVHRTLGVPYGQELAEALQAAGFSCEVTCCGISGYTSEELLNGINSPYLQNPGCGPPGEGLAHLLRDAGPFDLVILMVGTNDIGRKMATGISQDFSSRLHNACHTLDVPTVLIAPTTVTDGSTNQAANCHPQIRAQARDNRELLAEAMSTWASDNPQVLLSLDCEALVSKSDPHLWESDEIHFSIDGAKQLGRQMASQLEFVLEQLM